MIAEAHNVAGLHDIISYAVQKGASAIHLCSGNRPAIRVLGEIQMLDMPVIENEWAENVARCCMEDADFESFLSRGDADLALHIGEFGRFRVNVFKQEKGISVVMNIISGKIPALDDLGLPESVRKILGYRDGLVLVTGPTGNGKSTTLAALINEFNKSRKYNIITLEDPIEFIHKPVSSVISHREVGKDTKSFASGLRAALREDPNIILLGEMRDLESIRAAITAAETGLLVLSTLHTFGAAKTIDRIIDVFPFEQQQQVRTQISQILRAVISQRLLRTSDGSRRVAAAEIMFTTPAISNLIREGKTHHINQVIQTGVNEGMVTMENSLKQLRLDGIIGD